MKRIAFVVIITHLTLFIVMKVVTPSKVVHRKSLKVKTTVQARPTSSLPGSTTQKTTASIKNPPLKKSHSNATKKSILKPVNKNISKQKKKIKKTISNSNPSSKNFKIPSHLSKQLQESIAKIDQTSDKECLTNTLRTPKAISKLTVEQSNGEDQSDYAETLISHLKKNLTLPEIGEVKVELLIGKMGTLKNYRVISSKSLRNQRHLETELGALHYPIFTGNLISKQECTFVISFSNF